MSNGGELQIFKSIYQKQCLHIVFENIPFSVRLGILSFVVA